MKILARKGKYILVKYECGLYAVEISTKSTGMSDMGKPSHYQAKTKVYRDFINRGYQDGLKFNPTAKLEAR